MFHTPVHIYLCTSTERFLVGDVHGYCVVPIGNLTSKGSEILANMRGANNPINEKPDYL